MASMRFDGSSRERASTASSMKRPTRTSRASGKPRRANDCSTALRVEHPFFQRDEHLRGHAIVLLRFRIPI
jgi:hypothetical protein